MPIPNDTSPEIERKQIELLRAISPQRRLGMAMRLSSSLRKMAQDALASAYPELSESELKYRFIEIHYGRELADLARTQDTQRVRVH